MAITGVNSASKEIVGNILGQNGQNDAISKNIKNEIARAQKKLQDLSANNELSIEDKMKKRQEILQEITNLEQQLRQHMIVRHLRIMHGLMLELIFLMEEHLQLDMRHRDFRRLERK